MQVCTSIKVIVLLIIAMLLTGTVVLPAESLWPTEAPKSLLQDKKACKVGDVVTVLIVETASSSQSASTSAAKSSSFNSEPGIGPLLDKLPAISFGNGDSMKGTGSTNRSSNLNASMTVKITEIDEAGNMKIEGSREVQTNGEKAGFTLSGTIRSQDISQENTIKSTSIADAKIRYDGKGPIGVRQREGILQKIFKIFF